MSLNGKMDPAECVTLKNGSTVPRAVCSAAMSTITDLVFTDRSAFVSLIEKSRNPMALVDAGHLNLLQQMGLADERGNIEREVADVVCSAVRETATEIAIDSPVAKTI